MEKRKIMGIGLSALFFFGAVCIPCGKIAFADEGDDTTEPSEPTGTLALTSENADLFLPESYEQYLPLSHPIDVAIGDRYIAVAQDDKIYVCDRNASEIAYTYYQHEQHISKIQFSNEDKLYFSDGLLNFYELEFTESGFHADMKGVNASTFYIADNTLYVAAVSDSGTTYTMSDLSLPSAYTQFDKTDYQVKPQMAYSDGKLYCIVNSLVTIYQGKTLIQKPLYESISVTGLQSACAFNGHLYYSINNELNNEALPNGVYSCNLTSFTSTLLAAGNSYGALTAHNGYLYAIHQNSVLEYSVTENSASLTGYEIASSSNSVNRLSGAQDAVRAGDLLVTADTENRRVSVYSFSENKYSVIPCTFAPVFVATDGNTIAVASESEIFTCTADNRELASMRKMESNVKVQGLACIFGSVYYITNNNGYGVDEKAPVIHNYSTTSKRLTNDLYGNLYVSYADETVRSFTEDSFISEQGGTVCGSVPANHTSLRADFEGNLYSLAGNTLYKNGQEFATVDGSEFVFLTDSETSVPNSFALGFEDDEVYFLFGNYVVKSRESALEIPTLSKISAGAVADDVFSVHGAKDLLVEIPEKTVGITITLGELAGAEYFPYDTYGRLEETSRGVLLGETEKYCLVLLFHELQNAYTATLYQKSAVKPVDEAYYEEANGQYYLSSSVSSYFVPCLESALAETTLARGASVTVLGYLSAPDYDYALISYEDDSGEMRAIKTGYVPASFLTVISPLPSEGEEYLPVYLKANKDGLELFTKDGEQHITVTERTAAKAWKNADGSYTVCVEQDDTSYYATVAENQIEWKSSDALRIALIIILSVLALVIIGAYIFLLPKKTRELGPPAKKE